MNLQQISGETASSTVSASSLSDFPNLANASLYGFEDYHGVDIGVVRAVRLWYSPIQEYPIEINIEEGDVKLGFAVSRTEEVFHSKFNHYQIFTYFSYIFGVATLGTVIFL